jgi:hypothetical protein
MFHLTFIYNCSLNSHQNLLSIISVSTDTCRYALRRADSTRRHPLNIICRPSAWRKCPTFLSIRKSKYLPRLPPRHICLQNSFTPRLTHIHSIPIRPRCQSLVSVRRADSAQYYTQRIISREAWRRCPSLSIHESKYIPRLPHITICSQNTFTLQKNIHFSPIIPRCKCLASVRRTELQTPLNIIRRPSTWRRRPTLSIRE